MMNRLAIVSVMAESVEIRQRFHFRVYEGVLDQILFLSYFAMFKYMCQSFVVVALLEISH